MATSDLDVEAMVVTRSRMWVVAASAVWIAFCLLSVRLNGNQIRFLNIDEDSIFVINSLRRNDGRLAAKWERIGEPDDFGGFELPCSADLLGMGVVNIPGLLPRQNVRQYKDQPLPARVRAAEDDGSRTIEDQVGVVVVDLKREEARRVR